MFGFLQRRCDLVVLKLPKPDEGETEFAPGFGGHWILRAVRLKGCARSGQGGGFDELPAVR